jgi:hypothetical protein
MKLSRLSSALHQAGNKAAWWEDLDINALKIAQGLWEESRAKRFPTAAQAPRQQAPMDPSHEVPLQDTSKLSNGPN